MLVTCSQHARSVQDTQNDETLDLMLSDELFSREYLWQTYKVMFETPKLEFVLGFKINPHYWSSKFPHEA